MFDVVITLLAGVMLLVLVRALFRGFRPMLPPDDTGKEVEQSIAQRTLDRDMRG